MEAEPTDEGGSRHSVTITPDRPGRRIYTVYVMSDSYLGIDQQYDVPLEVSGDADADEIFYSDEEEMPTLTMDSKRKLLAYDKVEEPMTENEEQSYYGTAAWN